MIKSEAMQLAVTALRRNPKRTYASIKTLATSHGIQMYPIVYGRALKHLRDAGLI